MQAHLHMSLYLMSLAASGLSPVLGPSKSQYSRAFKAVPKDRGVLSV